MESILIQPRRFDRTRSKQWHPSVSCAQPGLQLSMTQSVHLIAAKCGLICCVQGQSMAVNTPAEHGKADRACLQAAGSRAAALNSCSSKQLMMNNHT